MIECCTAARALPHPTDNQRMVGRKEEKEEREREKEGRKEAPSLARSHAGAEDEAEAEDWTNQLGFFFIRGPTDPRERE